MECKGYNCLVTQKHMKNIKSKAGFALACSKLVSERDWVNMARQGKKIELEPELQKQILELFLQWYPKENEKYSLVMSCRGDVDHEAPVVIN